MFLYSKLSFHPNTTKRFYLWPAKKPQNNPTISDGGKKNTFPSLSGFKHKKGERKEIKLEFLLQ